MHKDWQELFKNIFETDKYKSLQLFLDEEYKNNKIYPDRNNIFKAFELTSYSDTKVVILGQDPYHGENQAHGLSFSIASDKAKFPPSLRNIFKEIESDVGVIRKDRDLTDWAEQGVLLLNTVLTVQAGNAGSHQKKGWEFVTDTVISKINEKKEQVIFVFWGAPAYKKASLITNPLHKIIHSAHPSPLSAHNGFFGSKPFSKINSYLEEAKQNTIVWG